MEYMSKKRVFKFNRKTKSLFKTMLGLKTIREAERFFRDLCTAEELRAMSERWEIAQMLEKGISYRDIADNLRVSTTTVARVAYWLENGLGGYKSALGHHHNSLSSGKGLR